MRILLADDHQLIYTGIQALLQGVEDYELLPHLVQRAQDLITEINRWKPDILLLDINLRGENALDYLPDIKKAFPNLRVVVISTYSQNSLLKKALESNVVAFLTKDLTLDELVYAIQNGTLDKPYVSEGIGVLHNERVLRRPDSVHDGFIASLKISQRELEIIRLVVAGLTTDTIAEMLYLSSHTVHTHRRNILQKLGLRSTPDLVKWALEHKI